MKPWREGDPVGSGAVYMPDAKTKRAYANACRRLWLDSAAKHVIELPTRQARSDLIKSYPARAREELKDKVRELWNAKISS